MGVIEDAAERSAWDRKVAAYPVLGRALANKATDPVGWAKARQPGIGASDAASFSKISSAPLYVRAKLYNPFEGNSYTRHGNEREPIMLAAFHIHNNSTLFASAGNPLHMATPDGVKLFPGGEVLLAEAKTTNKPFKTIPLNYRRQCQWQMYVMGAERTLFIWEEHRNGVPVDLEPRSEWIYRDELMIRNLVDIAGLVLYGMQLGAAFESEMNRS